MKHKYFHSNYQNTHIHAQTHKILPSKLTHTVMFLILFQRCPVQILTGIQSMLTKAAHWFPQFLQNIYRIISQIRPPSCNSVLNNLSC